MATQARWRGTDRELKDLNTAIARNCICDLEAGRKCGSHELIETTDQRLLDHLVFSRRAAEHFRDQEFDPSCYAEKKELAE